MTTTTTERAGLAAHPRARALLEDSWRLTPARMAERLTGGRFQRFRHVQFLEKKIAQAVGRGGARLVITMPPRHGKSWLGSLFTPAWYLSLWPERQVVLTASDAETAAAWGRGVRAFLKRHEAELGSCARATADRDGLVTAGVGGPLAGRGGDLLIVDDPLKSWKDASSEGCRQRQLDWFNSTLYTRAEPGASVIVIMTRWHEHDLAGQLAKTPGWETLRIPALAEPGDALARASGQALCDERFGAEALARIRESIGTRAWQSLYQQAPKCAAMLDRRWWRFYDSCPARFDELIQSWDVAVKGGETSDYVVGQVWGRVGADKYLVDQVRARLDFPRTLEAVRSLSARYPGCRRILVEDRANGAAVVASLRELVPGLELVTPEAGKTARVSEVVAEIERGRVHLPSARLAPWVGELIDECDRFPRGRHDDQVDAMAYALNALAKETV